MTGASTKLTAAVETWFAELGRLRATGGATGERSSYGPLAKLLDAVGATLRPKVFCVVEPVNQGAGHPDFGLYTSKQVQKGRPRKGQLPERGVVEVKSPREDTQARMVREQASRYWGRYRLVLVTNLREFALVGPDAAGGEATLESYRLAESEAAFARMLERPRASARTAAGAGDADAALACLETLNSVTLLEATEDAAELTQRLLDLEAVPRRAAEDAAHIAIAVTNGVNFLVTWNFRHIANAAMRFRIERVCREAGYQPTVVCTPNELMEPGHADTAD